MAVGLNATRKLVSLNLNNNFIGITGPEGPEVLLSVLPHLPDLDLRTLNLNGMTNISWSEALSTLQRLRSEELATQCQVSRCFGNRVPSDESVSLQEDHTLSQWYTPHMKVQTSGASSPSSFLRDVTRSLSAAYRMFQTVSEHPDVQMMTWSMIATQLAYAGLQTWPLLATTYLAIV